jgi:CheY-like chemotaxis protein
MARQENPSIVLMDYRLPGEGDGVDAAIEICGIRKVPLIYITASREPATLKRIESGPPAEIFIKPMVTREIAEALARHCPLEG